MEVLWSVLSRVLACFYLYAISGISGTDTYTYKPLRTVADIVSPAAGRAAPPHGFRYSNRLYALLIARFLICAQLLAYPLAYAMQLMKGGSSQLFARFTIEAYLAISGAIFLFVMLLAISGFRIYRDQNVAYTPSTKDVQKGGGAVVLLLLSMFATDSVSPDGRTSGSVSNMYAFFFLLMLGEAAVRRGRAAADPDPPPPLAAGATWADWANGELEEDDKEDETWADWANGELEEDERKEDEDFEGLDDEDEAKHEKQGPAPAPLKFATKKNHLQRERERDKGLRTMSLKQLVRLAGRLGVEPAELEGHRRHKATWIVAINQRRKARRKRR